MSRERLKLIFMCAIWTSTLVFSEECERSFFTKKFTATCDSVPFTRELDYCIPGQKVNDSCSFDNVCDYCPDGHFQDQYTNCKSCLACRTADDCPNGQVLTRECRTSSNAVCGCPPCPNVRCSTPPPVTCPPVPNTTCAPCLPCPTEPDTTTTPESTCPPCPTAEEKNPTSPSDDKSFTCPPVEPCPTPQFDPLVSSLEHELMWWKIWGIIAVIFPGLWIAYLLLYCCKADCLKKLCPHAHARFVDRECGNHKQLPRQRPGPANPNQLHRVRGSAPVGGVNNENGNVQLPPNGGTEEEEAPGSGNNKNGNVELPPNGGTEEEEAPGSSQSPQKDGEVHIPFPQVEDGGDEHDGGDEATKLLLEVDEKPTGAEGGIRSSEYVELRNMPKNSLNGEMSSSPQSMSRNYENAPMKEFSRPELGEEEVQEMELVSISEELYDSYWGQSFTSLPLLLSKLGFETKFYSKVLADYKHERVTTQIFYVLLQFQEERCCDRNYYRKQLRNVSPNLSDWFVEKINKECST